MLLFFFFFTNNISWTYKTQQLTVKITFLYAWGVWGGGVPKLTLSCQV